MENYLYKKAIERLWILKFISFLVILFSFSVINIENFSTLRKAKAMGDLKVNEGGDIIWSSKATTASYSIRWRTQGYHILLDETEYGYPFGKDNEVKREHVKIDFKKDELEIRNLTPDVKQGQQATFEMKIKANTFNKKIRQNTEFLKVLKKRVKKNGKTKVYMNCYFQTYMIVEDEEVKIAFQNKDNPRYKDRFKGGLYKKGDSYYDYVDSRVYKILSSNLKNVKQIKENQAWRKKDDWEKKENQYYNIPVEIEIGKNFLIKMVDESGNIIGDPITQKKKQRQIEKFLKAKPHYRSNKKEDELLKMEEFHIVKIIEEKSKLRKRFNPSTGIKEKNYSSFGVEKEEKKNGTKASFRLPKKVLRSEDGKVYRLKSCYEIHKKKKRYISVGVHKEGGQEDYQWYQTDLELEPKVLYGEYELSDEEFDYSSDVMEEEGEANPFAKIGAGNLEYSEFDIEKGIPVTERYYKNVRVEDYILNYRFVKRVGKKTYSARSKIIWNLSWTETVGTGKKVKTITKQRKVTNYYTTNITRSYSYWEIDKLEYYTLYGAKLINAALPDSGVEMQPHLYSPPTLDFWHSESPESHIRKPVALGGIIDLGERSGNSSSPPYYNPSGEVDRLVGDILVKNDRLSLGGRIYMKDEERGARGEDPIAPPTEGELCGERVLYEEGKAIESFIKNGNYDSEGKVRFRLRKSVNPESEEELSIDISDINSVLVHTPVVSDYIMDDAKKWCQLVEPDWERFQLILTKEFQLEIIGRGSHLGIKGYGLRDYDRYILKKEVIFPFDVLLNDRVLRSGEPIVLNSKASFRIPHYVKEGKYEIKLLSYALNSVGDEERIEEYANISTSNYVATKEIPVEVSGRLIDFRLENILHTQLWEKVFRNKSHFRGYPLSHLPLINGEHPYYQNMGDFKKGYALSFGVTTIGQYFDEKYGVLLELSFFAYDEEYKKGKEVDLYYEAVSELDGKWLGLVKVGNKLDRENLHFYREGSGMVPMFTYQKILLPKEYMEADSDKSIQRWRGEYSLPARLFICEKGVDIEKEAKKRSGFFYDEDFWIKEGKLVIKADIYSLRDNKKRLSYINRENEPLGHLNNWWYETETRRKVMKDKEIFFKDGEVFAFDIEKMIWLERLARIYKGW